MFSMRIQDSGKSRIVSFKYFCVGRKCHQLIFWSFFEVNFIFFSLFFLLKSIQLYNVFSIFVSLAVQTIFANMESKLDSKLCIANFANCCNMLVKELQFFQLFYQFRLFVLSIKTAKRERNLVSVKKMLLQTLS